MREVASLPVANRQHVQPEFRSHQEDAPHGAGWQPASPRLASFASLFELKKKKRPGNLSPAA
jgi:hypothetical protein